MLYHIERMLPSRLLDWLTIPYTLFHKLQQRGEFRRDKLRYNAHSSLIESSSSRLRGLPLEAQLTRDYHRVEKALALPAPKRPFGEAYLLARLNRLIPVGEAVAPDTSYVAAAVAAREALLEWNSAGTTDAAVAPVSRVPDDRGCSDPAEFFTSRHSVRNFSAAQVNRDDVLEAIRLATYSPSVCNRQPWKVRLFSGDSALRVLQHQNGNSGFRTNIPMLLLVSAEIGYFYGPGERNQAWIEGGIFASSLVWALHGLGLNSCMLNLSITNAKADRLREDAGMPASELPIMMIAVGYGAEGHRVARSHRRLLNEIVVDGGVHDEVHG